MVDDAPEFNGFNGFDGENLAPQCLGDGIVKIRSSELCCRLDAELNSQAYGTTASAL